eukprot:m.14810 g.14810  ORF g.14810 m.14810 type:complete len:69 (-) comp10289_c0_seq1:79-285(-)
MLNFSAGTSFQLDAFPLIRVGLDLFVPARASPFRLFVFVFELVFVSVFVSAFVCAFVFIAKVVRLSLL